MAASLTTTTADFVFKQLYAGGIDPKALTRKKPLLQWTDHKKNFTNHKGLYIPCPYVNPQGIGSTNADAVTNAASSEGVQFLLPQRHVYGYGKIDGVVVRNTLNGGDESQFVDALDKEVDGVTETIGAELHQRMYGTSTGIRSILRSGSAINTTTWYLNKPEDAQFYEPNMKIVLVNPATGLVRAGSAVTITKVDPLLGTLTCSGNPDSFTSAADTDGIARFSMVGLDLDGLAAWCPATVSGSDSFLGVNRSIYRTRLAGTYVDISGDPIRSGFIKALAVAEAQVGTMFEDDAPFFINPKNFAQIVQSVEATKVNNIELEGKYGVGLKAVEVMGYKFVKDSQCPVNTAYLVGTNAWTRASCGNQPTMEDHDGSNFWYDRDAGLLKFIMVHDGGAGSYEPYNIMRCDLPTAAL